MNKFNGDRLKNARLYRSLTVEELAENIGVSKQMVSQYEVEKTLPSFEKLLSIADSLGFPYNYFLQPDNFKITTGSTYFRSLLKTHKKYRVSQTIKMEHLARIYSILKEYIEFPMLNLPALDEHITPKGAAQKLRSFWDLGKRPISDIISILEENGIIVTMFATPTDDIDAFSHYVSINNDDIYLIALSNNKDTAARTHFDVAHELGHVLLHGWSESVEALTREQFKEKEKEANEFAAEFLLPEETFKRDASKYPNKLDYYVELKRKWKVSIAAMIYKACDLELISQYQYQYLWKIINKKGWRINEPLDNILKTQEPSLLKTAIEILLENDVFTPSEFLQELDEQGLAMTREEIEDLLCLPQGMLINNVQNSNNIISLKEFRRDK